MPVALHHRAEAVVEVEHDVAVDVPDPGALSVGEIHRPGLAHLVRGRDPVRERLPRPLVHVARAGCPVVEPLPPRAPQARESALCRSRIGVRVAITSPSFDQFDRVADADVPRLLDGAVDAEVDVLTLSKAAVPLDHAERVEVPLAGVRVARRRRAAGTGPPTRTSGLADAQEPSVPLVLLVGAAAAEADEHAEAPVVDGLLPARLPAQLLDRRVGEERHRLDVVTRPRARRSGRGEAACRRSG